MLQTYRGSCHCGAVTFEADLDLEQPTYRCNCTICRRTRMWVAVAGEDGVRVTSGESELQQYLFNRRRNEHWFCRRCGVRPFGIGTDTPLGRMYGVNLGCLVDVTDAQLAALAVARIDGLHDRLEPPEHGSHL